MHNILDYLSDRQRPWAQAILRRAYQKHRREDRSAPNVKRWRGGQMMLVGGWPLVSSKP
jgi:hypothetical protein